ncbi:hypothetical protein AX15_002633 [Amanita polypyramis BW_CC]|nr:hypothetical protein AX15_002633 [Amanita polypyramis BW_CC]
MPTLHVLVDDQDPDIEYLCDVSTRILPGIYHNDTWTGAASSACGYSGWFRYSFIGTGVQIDVATSSTTEQYSVQIDEQPQELLNGKGRYVSPELKDRSHNVTFFAGGLDVLPSFDYLTYTAGRSTPLNGKAIICDDSDATVNYDGYWTTMQPASVNLNGSVLYQNTAHWSTNAGDRLSYQFIGTGVAVMGVLGTNASLAFTLDGNITETTISRGSVTGTTAIQLFHATELQPRKHTLLINVTNVLVESPVGVDFLAYNASFSRSSTPYNGSISIPKEETLSIAMKCGIIGGITLLVGLVVCFFSWKWQRSRRFLHKFR